MTAEISTSKFLKHHKYVETIRNNLGYWGQDGAINPPRYSVCICNYNMADTLEKALKSVLNQLDPTLYEVLVIDDGSTDGSLSKLEELKGLYKNFRYISLPRERDRHLGETRNISIRAARGEYVLLHIDADDIWEPYLQDFVTLFHKIEEAAGHDIHLSGQQTGIGKRDLLLKYGPFENIYRCEDRNLMMKLARDNVLWFLDYRVYRTRIARPTKVRIFKGVWDDCSQMLYDMRQNEPKWPYIKHAFQMPFLKKRFSLVSRIIRPLFILPIYLMSRFMPPIQNAITRKEFHAYHEKNRGTYSEVMTRLGGNADMSFLSPAAQEIFSHKITTKGIRSAD